MFLMSNTFCKRLLAVALFLPSTLLMANAVNNASTNNAIQLDEKLLQMSLDDRQLKAGQLLFNTVCAACHKKDLSGAMGFNLKDGEWVHGSRPSDIVHNIKNGFAAAGMPAFSMMYNEQQINQIAAYVMSKREGWDNLTYKIFELPKSETRNFSQIKNLQPTKQGISKNNLADLEMPETKEFAAIFEGDFYVPKGLDATIIAMTVPQILIDIYIDGEKVLPKGNWHRSWALKPGKQHLKIKTMTPPLPFPKWTNTNLNILVSNKTNTIKYFPITTRANREFEGINIEIKATDKALVQRKKIVDLPTYTASVGLPEKLNYGFNTRSCAIVGMWQGELLNVGPNVKERGKDGSIMLGNVAFKAPQMIGDAKQSTCEFIKYNRQGNPSFYYVQDGLTVQVKGVAKNKHTLSFIYQIIDNTRDKKVLSLVLPVGESINVTSEHGDITDNTLNVDLTNRADFMIDVAIKGDLQ